MQEVDLKAKDLLIPEEKDYSNIIQAINHRKGEELPVSAFKDFPDGARASVDHILPQSAFNKIDGFDKFAISVIVIAPLLATITSAIFSTSSMLYM